MKSIFYDVDPKSPEYQQRHLGVTGASTFDNVMTPVKRAMSSQAPSLMYRKLAEKVSGEPLEIESMAPRPWMERGTDLEEQADKCYQGLQEVKTSNGGFWTDETGNIGCSPDRLVGEHGLLEIKCPLLPRQIETALTGDYGAHICQLQGQLYITGREWVDIFCYHPRLILDPKRIYRDEAFIADLAKALAVFVEEMQRRYAELLERFGPFPASPSIVPPPDPNDPMFVSGADVDAIIAAQRRERER